MDEKDKEILNEAAGENVDGINEENCEAQENIELTAEEKLQQGRRGYRAIWDHIMRLSVADMTRIYDNLDVHFALIAPSVPRPSLFARVHSCTSHT